MVQSLGGGGLTTAQLDTALATQTTALDTSLVDELDSTSRNFMRLRTGTVTMDNQSTTNSGYIAKLDTVYISMCAVQPATPDIDMTDTFMVMALNAFFDLANSDTAQFAYAKFVLQDVRDGGGTVPTTGSVSAKAIKTIQWPISIPVSEDHPDQTRDIELQIWGNVQSSGTMSATDISFVYYMVKGA
tara:strand:- start:264 stop:824 length:561 start_codon:yes stop_codon:yes gene_type:complete